MATTLHQPGITKARFALALGAMVNNLTLSPAGLALLEMIEQQTGVSFEVLHLWLDPYVIPRRVTSRRGWKNRRWPRKY